MLTSKHPMVWILAVLGIASCQDPSPSLPGQFEHVSSFILNEDEHVFFLRAGNVLHEVSDSVLVAFVNDTTAVWYAFGTGEVLQSRTLPEHLNYTEVLNLLDTTGNYKHLFDSHDVPKMSIVNAHYDSITGRWHLCLSVLTCEEVMYEEQRAHTIRRRQVVAVLDSEWKVQEYLVLPLTHALEDYLNPLPCFVHVDGRYLFSHVLPAQRNVEEGRSYCALWDPRTDRCISVFNTTYVPPGCSEKAQAPLSSSLDGSALSLCNGHAVYSCNLGSQDSLFSPVHDLDSGYVMAFNKQEEDFVFAVWDAATKQKRLVLRNIDVQGQLQGELLLKGVGQVYPFVAYRRTYVLTIKEDYIQVNAYEKN